MSLDKDDDDDETIKILMHSDEYAETTDQNEKNITIEKLNDYFDKMIDKSKSCEDQIESLEKVKNLDQNFIKDLDLKSKIFKLKLVHVLKMMDKTLFEKIFGHTLEVLANKLINTKNKKENQIIVKNLDKYKNKFYEMDPFNNDWVIQPRDWCIDLKGAIDFVLDFNENENENINENENENVNSETLMSSYKNDDAETMSQNKIKK